MLCDDTILQFETSSTLKKPGTTYLCKAEEALHRLGSYLYFYYIYLQTLLSEWLHVYEAKATTNESPIPTCIDMNGLPWTIINRNVCYMKYMRNKLKGLTALMSKKTKNSGNSDFQSSLGVSHTQVIPCYLQLTNNHIINELISKRISFVQTTC